VFEEDCSMRIQNKSDSKIIALGGEKILPGETAEVPLGFEKNPILSILAKNGTIAILAEGETEELNETAKLIASLKNAKQPRVLELCKQYGIEETEGKELPELKKLLIAKLTEAGDGDDGSAKDPPPGA
jgi:hypothetical protein